LPIEIDGKTYWWMLEVCRTARVSRSTLLRWLKRGIIGEPLRDRRGYRIFSQAEADRIRAEVERTNKL